MDFNPKGITAEGTFSPDLLIAGEGDIHTIGVTLEAEADLVRGTLVYKKATESSYSAYDGGSATANTLWGILVQDEDTTTATGTGATKSVMVYITGEFNANAITVASGTLEDLRAILAAQGIFLINPVVA